MVHWKSCNTFGGYKQSGYSREKGVDGLKSYLQVKNVGISLVKIDLVHKR